MAAIGHTTSPSLLCNDPTFRSSLTPFFCSFVLSFLLHWLNSLYLYSRACFFLEPSSNSLSASNDNAQNLAILQKNFGYQRRQRRRLVAEADAAISSQPGSHDQGANQLLDERPGVGYLQHAPQRPYVLRTTAAPPVPQPVRGPALHASLDQDRWLHRGLQVLLTVEPQRHRSQGHQAVGPRYRLRKGQDRKAKQLDEILHGLCMERHEGS